MNTPYVIAVITSLNCAVEVLCLRAIEPDSTDKHARTYNYNTANDCVAALNRFVAKAQRDAMFIPALRGVPEKSALPLLHAP